MTSAHLQPLAKSAAKFWQWLFAAINLSSFFIISPLLLFFFALSHSSHSFLLPLFVLLLFLIHLLLQLLMLLLLILLLLLLPLLLVVVVVVVVAVLILLFSSFSSCSSSYGIVNRLKYLYISWTNFNVTATHTSTCSLNAPYLIYKVVIISLHYVVFIDTSFGSMSITCTRDVWLSNTRWRQQCNV